MSDEEVIGLAKSLNAILLTEDSAGDERKVPQITMTVKETGAKEAHQRSYCRDHRSYQPAV